MDQGKSITYQIKRHNCTRDKNFSLIKNNNLKEKGKKYKKEKHEATYAELNLKHIQKSQKTM